MKKLILIISLALWGYFPVFSQFSDPACWDELLETTDNPMIRDSFLIQNFSDSPENNWEINHVKGRIEFQDAATLKLTGQTGDRSLFLYPGSEVNLQMVDPPRFANINISMSLGGISMTKNTILGIQTQEGENIITSLELHPRATYNHIHFNTPTPWIITGQLQNQSNPVSFPATGEVSLTFKSNDLSNSVFVLDHILAYGEARSHSLSRHAGYWLDHEMWSHGSPGKSRNALIRVPVKVNSLATCKEIYLHAGSITINRDNYLHCDKLNLIGVETAIYSQGEMKAEKQITVYRTFIPGKWNFISFPFDVYLQGLDPDFTLQDETQQGGGNFIYIMEYDSEKRSRSKNTNGSWKTISVAHPGHAPLLEKGKGYLVAIDEYATKQTVSFSSISGKPVVFNAGNIHLPIRMYGSASEAGDPHSGWQLCGNPLPSPLSLKQIARNHSLDGYIYYFSGPGYEQLPIGSDYQLPPFSAFFVKALEATDILIHSIGEETGGKTIDPSQPEDKLSEPSLAENLIYKTGAEEKEMLYRIKNNYLHVYNMPERGSVKILNMSGRTVFRHTLKTGNSTYHLPLEKGIYIIDIRSGSFQAQDKFIIN